MTRVVSISLVYHFLWASLANDEKRTARNLKGIFSFEMSVIVAYSQFSNALSGLGWTEPYPEQLWAALGGGEAISLDGQMLAELALSLGWSEEHGQQMWQAIQSVGQQLAAAAEMPWEQPTPPSEEKPVLSSSPPVSVQSSDSLTGSMSLSSTSLFLRRLAAALVDGLVFVAGLLAVCRLGQLPLAVAIGQHPPGELKIQLVLAMGAVTAIMLLYFSWSMHRPTRQGQSLGKQVFSLRVVSCNGLPISARQVLIRQGAGVVLIPWIAVWAFNMIFLPAGLLVGLILLLLSGFGLGLADRISGCKVIAN